MIQKLGPYSFNIVHATKPYKLAHSNTNHILILFLIVFLLSLCSIAKISAQSTHPRIYITDSQKNSFQTRLQQSDRVQDMVASLHAELEPYVSRHQSNPEWIISRLQMYWKTKYSKVFVKGMDFSHGEGQASEPTVRFSGSRDWATDYLVPDLKDVLPYMDDERGLYLQNAKKESKPWEWIVPAETGHIIERINEKILHLAADAAFLYWLEQDEKYAQFATDIFLTYMTGMFHREPPQTVGQHRNAYLMGLQTFEVIHERIVEPVVISYDFLYPYLVKHGADLSMITAVLKKWVEQEIKFGVPGNNWNLMQARYITYLALALENDAQYSDKKGQQYYLDQMLNQNSEKQKALVDVLKNFDPHTAIWPETAGYSTGVSEDILEIVCLIDRVENNHLLKQYPLVEKAILAGFQYLFPHGYTVAFGDAKHSRLRFSALELLIAQYRKYGEQDKEKVITAQLKNFMQDGAYQREEIKSLFQLFLYVDELMEVPAANSISDLVTPLFYAPNVSWIVQRNGMDAESGMMISKNASRGNHSHANGINIELFAKGLVFAPDCAAGVSYWSRDHSEYYSRFPSHNTVIVDGVSNYKTMSSDYAFTVESTYPPADNQNPLIGPYTFSDVTFTEPSTNARQRRLTATIRNGSTSGYFIDIFRSSRADGQDKKHEYLFHSQGDPLWLSDSEGVLLTTIPTDELSSSKGDLVGYDYFTEKQEIAFDQDFIAHFSMPAHDDRQVGVKLWMRGYPDRKLFSVQAPPSRAQRPGSIPEALYKQQLPTLVVRQSGEARTRPFVSVIEAFDQGKGSSIQQVEYLSLDNKGNSCVGIKVRSASGQVDYIFNDELGAVENTFGSQKFQGTYGVISTSNDQLKTMFLGDGKQLSDGAWTITSKKDRNSVLIQKLDEGEIHVHALNPFSLRMPIVDKDNPPFLEVVAKVGASSLSFKAEIIMLEQEGFALFQLPAMEDVILRIR